MDYQVQGPDGVQHTISGPAGASDEEVIAQAQNLFPGPSQTESFARGIENNVPLANQAIAAGSAALGDKSYSQNLGEQNQAIQASKAANPITYDAGAVTGALGTMAIPGVGEAMEAAPIASGAALGAANAIGNTDIAQNPGEALKQGLGGAAIGGALGGILPNGQKAASGMESIANKQAVQGLGLKAGMLGIPKEELEDLGQFASDIGVTQGPLEQRVGNARDLLGQVGAQVGEMGAGAAPLADASPFIEQLHQHLQESAGIFGAEANPETTVYRQALANLSKPNMTFDELQQLKTAIGKRAFDNVGGVKNDAAADVYRVYKDAMKSIIDGSPSEYQETMNQYGKLKDIESALTNQWQREQAGGGQTSGFGLAGKMTAMMTGGNPAATVATGAALAPAHPFMAMGALSGLTQNPQAMETMARSAATAIPKIASGARALGIDAMVHQFISNPQSYGKYSAPLMQALKEGGTQQFAATSFVMRQQHPELNGLMMGAPETNNDNQR